MASSDGTSSDTLLRLYAALRPFLFGCLRFAAPPKPGEGGPLKLDAMQIYVDPQAEWKHMYRQVWRDERDFFYDPGLHGVDPEAIQKKYAPYLEDISSRGDLNYLFEEML